METNNMNATAIGLFRSGITPIERLVETTVGRKEILDDLIGKLRQSAGKKSVQHFVFIGPRGIGKTHFLTLLETAVAGNEDLNNHYSVIRFPEENIRVLSFADMLLCIVQTLAETTEDDEWKNLYTAQSTNEDDQTIVDAVVPRLKNYRLKTGKMLLVLLENLDTLLSQQIKDPQDIHRLRTFLMDSPSVTLVATSPVYFPGLYDVKSPLYDFFDVQVIEDLSEDQTIDLIKRNLEWEKRNDLLEQFGSLIPKIRTIHVMTGGNPRLIMMLYQLVANDAILDTKVQFQKLLDQISPFYQDRLRDLAPQERAVLETIALMRDEPRTPAAIAMRLRKSAQIASSLLQRMAKAGYLTSMDNPHDKRSKIYRIKEGFFDLWLAMSESRLQKKRLPYLVECLSLFFQDQTEREKKRAELNKICESPECDENKKKNSKELLDYLSEIGDKDEQFVSKLDLAVNSVKEGRTDYALNYFKEIGPIAPVKPVFEWMVDQTEKIGLKQPADDIVKWFSNLIEYWKIQRSGDLEKVAEIAQRIGDDFSDYGLHQIRIELLKDTLKHTNDEKINFQLRIDIARSQYIIGQMDSAFESLATVLELSKIQGEKIWEGTALNNIGHIFFDRGDYDSALNYLKQSLSICKETGDKRGEGTTLNNISAIYYARGDSDSALNYLMQSLPISQDSGNKEGEATALNNISQIYKARGDLDNALNYLTRSQIIHQEIGNKVGICTTYFNIGTIYFEKKEFQQALQAWKKVYKLAKSVQLAKALNALNELAKSLNLPGGMDAWEKLANQEQEIKSTPLI
jgi:tetratricopeptide (TPR) repeat protein